MTKHTNAGILVAGGAAVSVLFSGVASAIDFNITGFVRQEISYNIASDPNPNNTMGRPGAGHILPHLTHAQNSAANAAAPTSVYVNPNGVVGGLFASTALNAQGFLPAGAFTSAPAGCWHGYNNMINAGSTGIGGTGTFAGTLCPNGAGTGGAGLAARVDGAGNPIATPGAPTQGVSPQSAGNRDDMNFNVFNTRFDVDVNARFNRNWSAFVKFRVYYDGTRHFTDGQIGDNFGNPNWGDRRATLTEWNSPDFLIDLPAAYVDWNRGPLWIRAGNQVIAWGEALFFRVADVANGLDLRRHLVLTPGAEEYQDQRIASPGVRVSYTFDNGWELDAFTQMFQPSILPGQNTAYNLVNTAVWLDEEFEMEDARGAMNFGFRMTMPFTDSFTGMFAFVNRRNPDGVVTSQDAPTFWNGKPNPFCVGANNDTNNLLTAFGLQGAVGGAIPAMPATPRKGRRGANGCGSAYGVDPFANGSIEFWDAIRKSRIDAGKYAIASINQWPGSQWATREIFGFGEEHTFADLYRTLEGFRSNFGGITQWVGREFKRENVFVGGFNYVTSMKDPSSSRWSAFLDQIIIRGEVSVTPNKRLFNDLSLQFTKKDDIVSALILEKYWRINQAFPATYMVAQWMHRTATDMFGRDLDKNDPPELREFINPVTGDFTAKAFVAGAMKPDGNSMADYVVFAFQQPFPNLVWRLDMSLLIDTAGGFLVQPGLRYRPSNRWQWDLYANVIESPGGDNDTITETLDFADEIFVRATYFF